MFVTTSHVNVRIVTQIERRNYYNNESPKSTLELLEINSKSSVPNHHGTGHDPKNQTI